MQEEAKGESSPDIATTFNVIGARQTLLTSYQDELLTAYSKNSAIEAEMKAKAQPAEEQKQPAEEVKETDKKQNQRGGDKKKKGKEAPTSLGFGIGTRKFFDYLLVIDLPNNA